MSLCGCHSICDFSHKKGREGEGEEEGEEEGEGEKHESGEREESACYKRRPPFSQLIR